MCGKNWGDFRAPPAHPPGDGVGLFFVDQVAEQFTAFQPLLEALVRWLLDAQSALNPVGEWGRKGFEH